VAGGREIRHVIVPMKRSIHGNGKGNSREGKADYKSNDYECLCLDGFVCSSIILQCHSEIIGEQCADTHH